MAEQSYSMVQECVTEYAARRQPDGSLVITIRVPERFADLWQVRLSDLRATSDEIADYQSDAVPGGS